MNINLIQYLESLTFAHRFGGNRYCQDFLTIWNSDILFLPGAWRLFNLQHLVLICSFAKAGGFLIECSPLKWTSKTPICTEPFLIHQKQTLEYLNIGTFENLNSFTLEHLNIGTFEHLNIQHSISINQHLETSIASKNYHSSSYSWFQFFSGARRICLGVWSRSSGLSSTQWLLWLQSWGTRWCCGSSWRTAIISMKEVAMSSSPEE